jgi:hypothetical protein
MCKVYDIIIRFQSNLDFLGRFSYKSAISNFTETRPAEATLIHVDRRTDRPSDMTEVTNAFRNYTNAPNKLLNRIL